MSNPLISILVAAYNVSPFIDQCLNSIQNQAFKNFEVIIVDDGSTDNTKNICKQYTEKDSRFSLIEHNNNKGLLLARKSAVVQAKGLFTIFIDGDDYLFNEHSLSEINSFIQEKDCDIYRFYATIEGTTPKKKRKWENFLNDGPTYLDSSIEILEDYFIKKSHPWNLWSSCYRTSILKDVYSKVIDKKFTSCEDGYTSFLIACNSNTYTYKKTNPIYSYRIGTGITTKKIDLRTFIKRAEEYKCINWLNDYISQSNHSHKERIYSCLDHFEDSLASAYVRRLLSLDDKEIKQILNAEYYIPCSRKITIKLIEKTLPLHKKIILKIKKILNS